MEPFTMSLKLGILGKLYLGWTWLNY